MATDEEVEAEREATNQLRVLLEEAKSGSGTDLREAENDITVANLKAEQARLEAEITQTLESRQAVVSGGSVPLASAEEAMRAAMEHQAAVANQVTTNNRGKKPADSSTPSAEAAPSVSNAEKE
jgi:hypothetical protein